MIKSRKPPGRKPYGLPKKLRVNICLSEAAYKKLHEIASKAGISASSWIESKIELAS